MATQKTIQAQNSVTENVIFIFIVIVLPSQALQIKGLTFKVLRQLQEETGTSISFMGSYFHL